MSNIAMVSAVELPEIQVPTIQPKMAQLLEFTQKNQSSVTPKDINAALDAVLRNYDELTARYAANSQKIDAELAQVRHNGNLLTSQLRQVYADLQQQQQAFFSLEAEQNARSIQWNSQVQNLKTALDTDIGALNQRIGSLHTTLAYQERILNEQRIRLDQFGVTQELLDSATRGNRSRIEAVREQTEARHAVVCAQIEGLNALQREQAAAVQSVQQQVAGLQTQTQSLEQDLQRVSTGLQTHVTQTQGRFRHTYAALAVLLALTISGVALVKWAPAFAPASTTHSVAQLEQRVNGLVTQLGSDLGALQGATAAQQEQVGALTSQVAKLEQNLGDMRQSVQVLRATAVAAWGDDSGLPAHDGRWLLRQNPKTYTVQLLSVHDRAQVVRFIDGSEGQLAEIGLAYSITPSEPRERYNLFYGVFDDAAQAQAAIDELPASLRAGKPWVRRLQAVQNTLR